MINTNATERSGIYYMLYPTHAADSKINKYKFLQYFTSICLELEKQEYCEYSSRTFPIGNLMLEKEYQNPCDPVSAWSH